METEVEGEENKEDSEAEEDVEKETEKTSTDHPLASLPGVAEGVSAALPPGRCSDCDSLYYRDMSGDISFYQWPILLSLHFLSGL